jgi:hypothetical protein
MTYRKDALTNLLAKIEAGNRITYDDTDRVCSILIPKATMVDASMFKEACMGDSLDAAKALHDVVLGIGFNYSIHKDSASVMTWAHTVEGKTINAYNASPARAWLIAILKALIAGENTNEREG